MPHRSVLSVFTLLLAILPLAVAGAQDAPAVTRVALQISDHDPIRQTMVLSVANNLINHYGADNVEVEIIAFGPGLTLLRRPTRFADRITELAETKAVRFSYCQITVDSTQQREGQAMHLVSEATATASGAVRIIDLVGQGYVHMTP